MSRELDAQVAEKVMGLRVDLWNWPHGGEPKIVEGESPVLHIVSDVPHYSTSIEAAWEVVEKMRGRGLLFDLSFNKSIGHWNCDIGNGSAPGETAPLAICLAALSAVSSEAKGV